jgi:lipopolysaccharide/colanic/teichoic acid biosynthesis glycosyltransferase
MGKILRKTKINELPQLINILGGDMSIVGFRPTVKAHYDAYPEAERKKFYNIRPGLTGLGSVAFRNEEEILHHVEDKKRFHRDVINPYKAVLEGWYADHKSLGNYFKLIFVTAYEVIKPESNIWKEVFYGLPEVPEVLEKLI